MPSRAEFVATPFVACAGSTLIVALSPALPPASSELQSQASPLVATRQGSLEGTTRNGLAIFKGIPYALPPVGARRWRKPQPSATWHGARKAAGFGNACIQDAALSRANGGDPGRLSEDCLYLNVWTPSTSRSAQLPVMVWIHGGALVFGSGSLPLYDGSPLAQRGAVVVTINYRLGQLGFFSHPALDRESRGGPVNFGLYDQIAALQWVQQNIAAFGGDPANVTIFGQSAGGQSILALFASPLAKGLFQKGIAQSPYGVPGATRVKARATGAIVADSLGLKGASATLAQLRAVPAEKFLQLKGSDVSLAPGFVIGDPALPKSILKAFQDGTQARLPLIIGSNSDDATVAAAFGIDPAAVIERLGAARVLVKALYPDEKDDSRLGSRTVSDLVFTTFGRRIAELHAAKAPSWRYHFDYVPVNRRDRDPGAPHGGELAFVMGTADPRPPSEGRFTAADHEMSRRVGDYWFEFARSGKPLPAGAPPWPQYHARNDMTMNFDETISAEPNFMRTRLRVFTGLLNSLGAILGR